MRNVPPPRVVRYVATMIAGLNFDDIPDGRRYVYALTVHKTWMARRHPVKLFKFLKRHLIPLTRSSNPSFAQIQYSIKPTFLLCNQFRHLQPPTPASVGRITQLYSLCRRYRWVKPARTMLLSSFDAVVVCYQPLDRRALSQLCDCHQNSD